MSANFHAQSVLFVVDSASRPYVSPLFLEKGDPFASRFVRGRECAQVRGRTDPSRVGRL